MNVVVIGTGYVGLVTGVCLAYKGHRVTCVEKRKEIVEQINLGISPIYEKELEAILRSVISNKNYTCTTDLSKALNGTDIVMIAVGTPFKNGFIDLYDIQQACEDIGLWLKKNKKYVVIVVKSTVVPSTTDSVILPILEKVSGKECGKDFGLCTNPEFLREGNAIKDFMNPDRIIIGSFDEKSSWVVQKLYENFDAPAIISSLRTAEMVKYTSNALLTTLISFSNEMANLCAAIGDIDIKEVMQGVHLDRRLNPIENRKRVNPEFLTYLEAGCGFGGSCFPKDVNALISFSKKLGQRALILETVISTNSSQPLEILKILKSIYPKLNGLKVAVLGLAFKPDTNDVRESPSITVVNQLIENGAEVFVYDPVVGEEFNSVVVSGKVSYAKSWQTALSNADAGLLITKWPEFKDITQDKIEKLMRHPIIIDGRRMLKREGFSEKSYYGIGYYPKNRR